MPWMLIYSLSTIAMNHRSFFREAYGGELAAWEHEQQQIYPGSFSHDADLKLIAPQILSHLDLDGVCFARRSPDGRSVTVYREDPLAPRRITFTPADGKLVVEKQVLRPPVVPEELHRRRGFDSDFVLSDAWAVTVDLVIVAIVFWALSGLWMWWELKSTRRWGALCFLFGSTAFLGFVALGGGLGSFLVLLAAM